MNALTDSPFVVFAVAVLGLSLSARIGATVARRWRTLDERVREDFGVVLGATLTLLGLIIGFSFSMAISRHDQRKQLEAAEANAIGTEYVRADLLPAADTARVRMLLRRYLDQRVLFYHARDGQGHHGGWMTLVGSATFRGATTYMLTPFCWVFGNWVGSRAKPLSLISGRRIRRSIAWPLSPLSLWRST